MIVDVPYYRKIDFLPVRNRIVKQALIRETVPVELQEFSGDDARLLAKVTIEDYPAVFHLTPSGVAEIRDERFNERSLPWKREPPRTHTEMNGVVFVGEVEALNRAYAVKEWTEGPYERENEIRRAKALASVERIVLIDGKPADLTREPVLGLMGDERTRSITIVPGSFLSSQDAVAFFRLGDLEKAKAAIEEYDGHPVEAGSIDVAIEFVDRSLLRFDPDDWTIRDMAGRFVNESRSEIGYWPREQADRFLDLRDALERPGSTCDEIASLYFGLRALDPEDDNGPWLATKFLREMPVSDEDAIADVRW